MNEKLNNQATKHTVDSRLLLRIAADLQKEQNRTENELAKQDLQAQINGLKVLHKEIEDYRTLKRILNNSY
jgi:hypothetical protein